MVQLKKKDKIYYTRILSKTSTYEVCELIVRTVSNTWFVAIDKMDKHAYLFSYNDIDKILFFDREIALLKVVDAEENQKNDIEETDSEGYFNTNSESG